MKAKITIHTRFFYKRLFTSKKPYGYWLIKKIKICGNFKFSFIFYLIKKGVTKNATPFFIKTTKTTQYLFDQNY